MFHNFFESLSQYDKTDKKRIVARIAAVVIAAILILCILGVVLIRVGKKASAAYAARQESIAASKEVARIESESQSVVDSAAAAVSLEESEQAAESSSLEESAKESLELVESAAESSSVEASVEASEQASVEESIRASGYTANGTKIPEIDEDASGILARCLDYATYVTYTYDDTLSFSYPGELFNQIDVDDDATTDSDGFTNVVNFTFTQTQDSGFRLIVQKAKLNSISTNSAINTLYDEAEDYITTGFSEVRAVKVQDSTHASFVVTGYPDGYDGRVTYYLVAIEDGAYYKLVFEYAPVTSNDDKKEKWYVTECVARCFSHWVGSTNSARTYTEFLDHWSSDYDYEKVGR